MRSLIVVLTALVALVASAAPAQATFPGRNGGIAFAQQTGSGDLDPEIVEHARLIVALPPLGSKRQRTLLDCTTTGGVRDGDCIGTGYSSPSYSPDGERIVFDAGERVALIDAGGGDVVLLPATTANDGNPCFSPDGERIAFTGVNDHGSTDIYTRRLDGGPARQIIRDAGEPAWSSRDQLAYVRSGNVYTAPPSGGQSARRWVTSGRSPDWSPNGRRLAVVRPLPALAFDDPIGRMYLVDPNGRHLSRVGRLRDVSHPAWSPDGRWVAYDGFDLGIFAKRLGSREPAREVARSDFSGESGFVSSFDPAWRPVVSH